MWALVCAALITLPGALAAAQQLDDADAAADTTAAPPPDDIFVYVFSAPRLTEDERIAIEVAVAAGVEGAGKWKVSRTPAQPSVGGDVELVSTAASKALERSDTTSNEAHELVRHFDFEGALDMLDWAADEYSKNLVALMIRDGNATKLLDVYVQTAIVHYLNGDEEPAARALGQAFVIEPALQYTAERFPPQLEGFVAQQRLAFDETERATLNITSTARSTRVFVNGIERGVAPIEVHDVPPGANFVTFVVPGAGQETVTVEIDGDQTVDVSTDLAPVAAEAIGPLADAQSEVGAELAGKKLGNAAKELGVGALLLVVATPKDATIELVAYVYDMRTGTLSGRGSTEVDRDNPAPVAEQLGVDAMSATRWELHVVITSPSLWDRTKGLATRAYEWDYFWHTVGATAGVLVLTTVVIAAEGGLSAGKMISVLPVIDF